MSHLLEVSSDAIFNCISNIYVTANDIAKGLIGLVSDEDPAMTVGRQGQHVRLDFMAFSTFTRFAPSHPSLKLHNLTQTKGPPFSSYNLALLSPSPFANMPLTFL